MFLSKMQLGSSPEHIANLMNWLKTNRMDSYSLHQLLWKTFPKDENAERDFLFREEENPHTKFPQFFVLSNRIPESHLGMFNIQTKEYNPSLLEGQRYHFNLRVNAVVSRTNQNGKSSRHDIWMDAKTNGKAQGLTHQNLTYFVEKEVKGWLVDRSDSLGCLIQENDLLIEGKQDHKVFKGSHGKGISYGAIDFVGTLKVVDVELFKKALINGIGKSKAFGCGLILIRRA